MGQVDGHLDDSELAMLHGWAAALHLRLEEDKAIHSMMQNGATPDSISSAFS